MSEQEVLEKVGNSDDVDKQKLAVLTKYYQTTQPRVAELTKQVALKDKIISALKNNLSDLQKERDQTIAAFETFKSEHKNGVGKFEGKQPERVLERMISGGRTWCLVQYPEEEVADDLEDDDETLNEIWMTQEELVERVNEHGCNLDLPPPGLSSQEAGTLRTTVSKLEETLNSLEAEYKKYRVDMEMMIWNKNSQIETLQTANSENSSSISTDMNTKLQMDYESLKMQKEDLVTRNQELTTNYNNLEADKEMIDHELSETKRRMEIVINDSEEWKRKYKDEIRKRREDVVDKESEGLEEESRVVTLKKEIELLKARLQSLAKQKSSFPTENVEESSSAAITEENYEYLRNIVKKYFISTDKEAKNRMSSAILTVLKFSPQEIVEIKKSSKSFPWW
ncbi:hypothetical protein WA158_006898 [Blastocystis sp. Blastoise]